MFIVDVILQTKLGGHYCPPSLILSVNYRSIKLNVSNDYYFAAGAAGGMMTVSITWMMPLLALIFAAVT
jgi:hypothetical protein